jgi:hypothetical protein
VVAAAAVEHPATTPAGGSGGEQAAAGSSGDSGWGFPLFVGHRRRLAPDDELFEAGNIEREQLAHQVRGRCTVLRGCVLGWLVRWCVAWAPCHSFRERGWGQQLLIHYALPCTGMPPRCLRAGGSGGSARRAAPAGARG